MANNLPYLWDYNISENDFTDILAGNKRLGRLDRDWAAVRILEYASYREIVQLLGFPGIVDGWPQWREKVRSQSRVRGFDFLVTWLVEKHPELLRSEALHAGLTDG